MAMCISVNCQWSVWGEWSKCSVTCGDRGEDGTRERNRHIVIEGQHGGIPCEADNPKQFEECIHCTVRPERAEAEARSKSPEHHKKNCIPHCPSNSLLRLSFTNSRSMCLNAIKFLLF